MKAARIHRFGPPDVIALEDVEMPRPRANEVLVRIVAAGVGPWDALIRSGGSELPQRFPITLGADLSGTVEAVGSNGASFAAGDAVFGATADFVGAYAEYAVVPTHMLAPKPQRIDYVDAGSVPVVAVTAAVMLERAFIAPGQTVLIHGAAGAVGGYAVQFAHLQAAPVVAIASPDDADYVRGLGADEVIDRDDRFEDRTGTVDAVMDTVGGDVQTRSFAVIKPGGYLVSVASPPDETEAKRRQVHVVYFIVDVSTPYLARIARAIDAGRLRTKVGVVLPLAEAREAHKLLEGRQKRARGKIVLQVANI